MKPPAFQFYADDFLSGTMGMTSEEVGVYIRLLCVQWSNGFVPDDPEVLKRLGGAVPTKYVMSKFQKTPSGFKNERMEKVRKELNRFKREKAEAGRLGAERRWHSHSTAICLPMAKHGPPSPTPTPYSLKEKFNSLGDLEKEPVFVEACELVFGQKTMVNWGGTWRNNFRECKDTAIAVLRDVLNGVSEGTITKNPGGYANQLWKKWRKK